MTLKSPAFYQLVNTLILYGKCGTLMWELALSLLLTLFFKVGILCQQLSVHM